MVATATENVVEVEIDGPHNEACIFRPLQRRIRGRFELRRIAEPLAMTKHTEHPDPIPGQRLRLNIDTGLAELIEPLRMPEFAAIRQRYEFNERGEKTATFAEDEAFENVDVPTWLYWMKAEKEAGNAKLLAGTLPDKIEGKIRRSFYTTPPENHETTVADAMTKMADAMAANTAVMTELLKRMTGGK